MRLNPRGGGVNETLIDAVCMSMCYVCPMLPIVCQMSRHTSIATTNASVTAVTSGGEANKYEL